MKQLAEPETWQPGVGMSFVTLKLCFRHAQLKCYVLQAGTSSIPILISHFGWSCLIWLVLFVEGANAEASRRKSLSAASKFGQSAVPAWLRAKRAAATGLLSVSENPQTADTGSASKAQQRRDLNQGTAGTAQASSQPASAADTKASHGSQTVTQQAAAVDAAEEEGRSSGPVGEADKSGGQEQSSPVRSSISQVIGSLTQVKGSITQAIGSIGQVIGGTPFSAFAHQSLTAQSHTSSNDSESDQLPFKHLSAEPLSLEESRGGGSLTRRKSGPFGGRGVALGHMMAAQQQWRQDSFSKAQVCENKRNEKAVPSGVNSMRSKVVYGAAQGPGCAGSHLL